MADRYVFAAIFRFHRGGVDVEFPDLPGCYTHGANQEEALEMAREALGLHLFGMEQDGDPIPTPTRASDVKPGDDEVVVLVDVWMPPIRGAVKERSVKKTLTIPRWLDDLAERRGVNFSSLLQAALKHHLGIRERP